MSIHSRPVPGLVLTDHTIDVPLDHADPARGSVQLYAREVRAVERADDDLPWLLFLQGGPGGRGPRPVDRSGWLGEAVAHYRVLLLDQRGTGRSSPVTDRTPSRFAGDDDALAHHLGLFRADAIVRDAELLRRQVAGGARWTTLGQSYGGFCTLTYLSLAPEGLEKCLITGGVPGLGAGPDDVYRRTWPRVLAKNVEHARRFPGDHAVVSRLRDVVRARPAGDPVRLPGGDPLTVERLQAVGTVLGMSYGFAELHYLLETAFDEDAIATGFLEEVEQRTSHRAAPLYAVLQEVIYCGPGVASQWSAGRIRAGFPELAPDADRLLFTGEMKEADIFRDEAAMRPFAGAMEILNARTDWPDLYDLDVLAANEVPVAAAIYDDDLYVDADLSRRSAALVGRLRPWVTNEFEHDGLRTDGRVFTHLHDLVTGRA